MGIEGIKVGAATGLVTGQPIVGGIAGGLAGFTIGFVGEAIIAGGATYVANKAVRSKGTVVCEGGQPKLKTDFVCLDQFC